MVDIWQRAGATLAAGVKLIPSHLCAAHLSAARHNELLLFYDRAWPDLKARGGPGGANTALTNMSLYTGLDADKLRWYNMRLLVQIASPLGCFREFMGVRKHTGHAVRIACLIPQRHYHPSHLPSTPLPAQARELAVLMLELLGLKQVASTASASFFWRMPLWHAYNVGWSISPPGGAPSRRVMAVQNRLYSDQNPPRELHVTERQQTYRGCFCNRKGDTGGPCNLLARRHAESFPPPVHMLLLPTTTSLDQFQYPLREALVTELKPSDAIMLSDNICSLLAKLRVHNLHTSGTSLSWYQLPHGGPLINATGFWHDAFSSLEPFCMESGTELGPPVGLLSTRTTGSCRRLR